MASMANNYNKLRTQKLKNAKLIDVTLRDGGFQNNFSWTEKEIEETSLVIDQLNCQGVEIGYIGGVPELHSKNPGPSANIPAELIQQLKQRVNCDIVAMLHPSAAFDSKKIPQYAKAGLDLLRIVYHQSWHKKFVKLAEAAQEANIPLSFNIALCSHYTHDQLKKIISDLLPLNPEIIYLADTSSSVYPTEVMSLFKELQAYQVKLGFHAHNYLSLALANSMVAVEFGGCYVDSTIAGVGRGAGNLATELWLLTHVNSIDELASFEVLFDLIESKYSRYDAMAKKYFVHIISAVLNLTPAQEDLLTSCIEKYQFSQAIKKFTSEVGDDFI